MENLVEDNGICDCHYLLTMRLALQKEVDCPFERCGVGEGY